MHIWLTSGQGFLGRELLPKLSQKYHVSATNKQEVDLLDGNQVDAYISSKKVDVIVHTAIKGGRRIKQDNASVAYENILMYENLAKNNGKIQKLINFDSAACFDRRQNILNYKESDLGKHVPIDFYGFSKMNIALRSLQVKNSYNLRIFNCFGPSETVDRMTKANIIKYIEKEEITVFKNKWMDIFYIDDLWTVLDHYLQHKSLPKDINLVYEKKNTLLHVAEMINELNGHKSPIKLLEEGMDNSYTGDASLVKSLGFNFFGIEHGLNQMFQLLNNKHDKVL